MERPPFSRHSDKKTEVLFRQIVGCAERLRLFPGAGQQVFQQFRDDEQARPAVFIGAAGFVNWAS